MCLQTGLYGPLFCRPIDLNIKNMENLLKIQSISLHKLVEIIMFLPKSFCLMGLLATTPTFAQSTLLPLNLGAVINSDARDAEPTFTADGNTMYFNCFDREGKIGSDICVSRLENGEWKEPEIVKAVSTDEHMEVEPLLSHDGRQLYIMSTRAGGEGGMDFWVSDLLNGEWTEPKNLKGPFNTPYADHCIYFTGEN